MTNQPDNPYAAPQGELSREEFPPIAIAILLTGFVGLMIGIVGATLEFIVSDDFGSLSYFGIGIELIALAMAMSLKKVNP